MIKKLVPIALFSAILFSMNSCKSGGGFKTTESGLQYQIVKDEKTGQTPAVGDLVEIHMIAKYKDKETDTTLFNSRQMNNGNAMSFPLPAPSYKGDIVEAFMLLTPGDSAVIRMSVDSFKKQAGGMMPPYMKDGEFIEYNVVMVSVKSQKDMQQEKEKHDAEQIVTDEKLLQDYFTANSINPAKTVSGVYYTVEKDGKGENVKNNQQVTVKYTGKTLDGKAFDSNTDPQFNHVEPFIFTVGRGEVIPGWDEGLTYFKKGSKGKLFIPSTLAYGAEGRGEFIPKDAILVFDIEVVNIEDAPAPQNMPVQ